MMNSDLIREENIEFILARLHLAQALLEESDALPGIDLYNINNIKKIIKNPRYEREALVNYLLLTCFDRLGQECGFTTFQDWLKSKKLEHVCERQQVLKNLKATMTPLDSAIALADQYQSLYGVRNSFYRGIESLPKEQEKKLLDSISIGFDPIYGTLGPNTSTPSYSLNDDFQERKLKLKYLYNKRNRFTHRLEQHYEGSNPVLGAQLLSRGEDGPSWCATIKDSCLSYISQNVEIERLPTGGARKYWTTWPFDLFETLHAAVESPFHRTDIKLRFAVMLFSSDSPAIALNREATHEQLKYFENFELQCWENHAKSRIY